MDTAPHGTLVPSSAVRRPSWPFHEPAPESRFPASHKWETGRVDMEPANVLALGTMRLTVALGRRAGGLL